MLQPLDELTLQLQGHHRIHAQVGKAGCAVGQFGHPQDAAGGALQIKAQVLKAAAWRQRVEFDQQGCRGGRCLIGCVSTFTSARSLIKRNPGEKTTRFGQLIKRFQARPLNRRGGYLAGGRLQQMGLNR